MADGVFRKLWMAWEAVFRKAAHVQTLGDATEEYLFFVAKRRYVGHAFEVNGVPVRTFDPVIELHMNNEFLFKMLSEETSMIRLGVKLLAEAKRSFPALARLVSGPLYANEKVLYGTTFIHRSVERFGLQTFPFRSRFAEKLFARYLQLVFRAVNPNAAGIIKSHKEVFIPRMVAISKEQLIRMHAPELRVDVE